VKPVPSSRIRCGLTILILVVAAACGPSEKTVEPDGVGLPPASVLIFHHVVDFDEWKTVFDDHIQARKDASCLGHYLKRGVEDLDIVYVYCLATNVDRLRKFLDSDDLAEAMKNAGVVGDPTITLMKPMSRDLVSGQMLPGIIVMHPVEDYDAWRVVYDELDDFRRQNGIVGHAVSREFDNPNRVIVYHQASDVAALRTFVESAELEDTMQRAGVVGDPEIRYIQVVGFAGY
jgi:hypothetical protein